MIINSRNDKSMPMNSEFVFDVSRIIKPKKLVVPYYTLGTENVAWVDGRTDGAGARSKELDHLYLFAEQADDSADRSYSTVLVDLTKIKTLFIDWENTGATNTSNRSFFMVSTAPDTTFPVFVAQLDVRNVWARRVDELDVSAISGEYHVIVFARDGTTAFAATCEIRTYRVWGEG